ncbi:MAG TPA: ABC transporter permease [Gammaproteobacteria bacterium]|nr:ABC transporter permease [Gammaproteobacteria bacterium]
METLNKDIKHAWRMFRENKLFTATAIAALTLGIGVNIAIFSVVNAVLLKPVPFPDPDTLVQVVNANNGVAGGPNSSPAKYMHWRAQNDVLESVAAARNQSLNYGQGELLESIAAGQVSAEYFDVLRPPLVMGRWFTAEEDLPNAGYTVVLSYNFWTQHLNSDPEVVGKSITLSGNPYTVVGVVAREFDVRDLSAPPEIWVPFQLDPNTVDQGHFFTNVARLKPGVTLEQAQAKLLASASAFRDRFGQAAMPPTGGFTAITLQESLVRQARPTLLVALGAVGFVLLIACANVANLLLIRATGRRKELAVRTALGAGRWRIMRQLLTESLMLSFAGGALGLLAGYAGMRWLLTVNTAGLPRLGQGGSLLGMDWRVVVFTIGLSIVTGILFGLIPALVASRTDLNTVIKDSSSRSGSGFRQNKTRSVLVLVEVSLAVVLLVGAALLIRTSLSLSTVDPGYTTENVLIMRTSLTGQRYQSAAVVDDTARLALERIRALPGVAAASMTCCIPLQGALGLPFNIVGRTNEGPFTGGAGVHFAVAGYFDTFEIKVVRGRAFNDSDTASSPPVIIINESFAKQFWKDGADPLADQMLVAGGAMREFQGEPVRQIVGIVADVRAGNIAQDPGPMMFVPIAQMPDTANAQIQGMTPMGWVIRTSAEPGTVSKQIQDIVRETTGAPVTSVQNMDDVVSVNTSRQRLNMLLMTIFGASALVLAAIGIYGLMAYSVQHRTQEIGIRMALGAQPDRVRWSIVGQGMTLVGVGIVIGVGAALYLATFLAAALYGVQARNPLVFVGVPVVLAATAFAAVWIAARRASRIDPLNALRYE